ncbi:hypothetical protein [Roseateles sp.]|uniref:hypothetical protein n=1 Tax=Roseateles sp. TaxID=1971397 RepID=UPI002E032E30|nr:hypothetical protein [Roseateles sp.]
MQYTVNLTAGQTWRQQTAGGYFLLMSIAGAASIQVRLVAKGGQELENILSAGRGLKARMPAGQQFEAIEFTAAAPCAVTFIISDGFVDIDVVDGAVVTANIAGLPLPVSNDRGSPGNLLYVSAVTASDAPATAVLNDAPVACGPAIAVLAAANANRRALRFTNFGPDPVALGAPGLTWANRCIVLQVGDSWVEERAANLAWSGITDAAKAASVGVQEVLA